MAALCSHETLEVHRKVHDLALTRHDARLTSCPSSTTMPLIPPLDASMLSREPWAYWLPDYNHIRVMRQVDTVVVA